MSIPFDEHTLGVWNVALGDGDWLAVLRVEDGKGIIDYRFRWYLDDKDFDSKDIKHFYRATPKEGRDPLETARFMFQGVIKLFRARERSCGAVRNAWYYKQADPRRCARAAHLK